MNPHDPPDPHDEDDADDANAAGHDEARGDAADDSVINDLIDQSRTLTGSRMIPSVGPLTDGHHQQVRDALNAYLERHALPVSRVASGVRMGESTISEWRHGKNKGDVDKVARAVNVWLERETRRRAAERPVDYVPTRVAELMYAIIADADRRTMMAAIVAPSGSGKTKVLEAYAKDARGGYLDCREAHTAKTFLLKLLVSVGLHQQNGTRDVLLAKLLAFLKSSRSLILLDEAHNLAADQLKIVRTIHDLADVPIVMAGTGEIFALIDDRQNGRGQFSSRCLFFNLMAQYDVTGDDAGGGGKAELLFTVEEVRRFFDSKRMRLDTEALDLLWKLACLPMFGGLRFAYRLAEQPAAKVGDGVITYAMIQSVLRKMLRERVYLVYREVERFEEAVAKAAAKGRVA